MKKLLFVFLCLFLMIGGALAEENPSGRLFKAKSIRCYWDKGAIAEWITKKQLNITVEKYAPKKEDSYSIFDSIDIKNGKARIIAQQAGDVIIIASPEGVNFIEQTPSGNLSITTVFPVYYPNSDKFICVLSRPMNYYGGPLAQQYYGTAEILE